MTTQPAGPQYDYDGHIMRTPDEWCRIKQIQILDPDGWRGRDGKDWTEPLTELDFEERAQVCTQRSTAGEHHTGTLNLTGEGNAPEPVLYWCPTARQIEMQPGGGFDTCCHAPELHEPVLAVVYAAIRQQVAEEIAAKAFAIAEEYQATAITHRELSDEHGRTLKGTSHMTTAHAYRNKADGAWAVAHAAREVGGAA